MTIISLPLCTECTVRVAGKDGLCNICSIRLALKEHDHLHLGGAKCTTAGIGGRAGEMVRCKCGGFHH